MPSPFLTAEWRKLLMAQYEVQPKLLAPYLPRGLELDLFEGRCFVSLVAFLFDRVRVKGFAVPLHTSFEEINLRFYVRRTEPSGSAKRGVVFVREFVPRRAIAWVAKSAYEEPYLAIPTRHSYTCTPQALTAEYGWKYGNRWYTFCASAASKSQPIAPGSEEEFITEHYWGYTKRSDGSTSAYQVEHPRWQTYRLQRYEIAVDLGMLYGPEFAFLNGQPAASVLLAEGSAVKVYSGVRPPV
ncbi:MAG TPA: DUF2071 domain-containing protein [Acidobacteriaceae bacterium]|jgi:hypothetical protein|nr:DUF2071 domain-containing protein [Acidobacteriaceae bacterium]